MQQRPGGRETYSVRTRRTNPALPGATLPTAPVTVHSPKTNIVNSRLVRGAAGVGRAVLWLCVIGVLIELFTLALYPVLANATYGTSAGSVTTRALTGLFPWLTRLYWQPSWPPLAWFFAHVPWFNPATMAGNANLFALLAGLAFVLSLCAVQVGSRIARKRLERADVRLLFCIVLCFTILFGITYMFIPGGMTQDTFLYGLYGRMVTVYHVNPYVVSLASFPHDIMQQGLAKGTAGTAGTSPFAPAWIDFSIPVMLLARDSIANVLLGFRALGLIAHVLNAVAYLVDPGKTSTADAHCRDLALRLESACLAGKCCQYACRGGGVAVDFVCCSLLPAQFAVPGLGFCVVGSANQPVLSPARSPLLPPALEGCANAGGWTQGSCGGCIVLSYHSVCSSF